MGFNKKSRIVFLFFLVFTLFFSFQVSAQPQTNIQVSTAEDKIQISYPKLKIQEINKNFKVNFRTFNVSSGKFLDNNSMDCNISLINKSGDIFYQEESEYNPPIKFWENKINKSYFDELGNYRYEILCIDGEIDGFVSGEYKVTETGEYFSDANTKTYDYSLFVMLFFSVLFFIVSTTFNDKDSSEVNKKNKGARFFFISLSLVTAIIAVLYIMTTMQTVMPDFSALISGFSTFHYVILSVLFVLFIFIMINITFKLLEDMKAKSGRVPGRFNPYRQGRRMNPGRGFG